MNSRLTVSDVRAQLWTLADPNDINSAKFLRMLNEVCEKYILSGKWKGAVVNVDFASADGYISLPYEYYSVLCLTYNKCPAMTFSQFHTYQENGPGELDDTKQWPGILIDLGDGFDVSLADLLGRVVMLTMPMESGLTSRLLHCLGEVTINDGQAQMIAAVRRDAEITKERQS